MRLMAIDYGTKKIGLAFTDPTCSFVSATRTIMFKSEKTIAKEIANLATDEKVSLIILGYPLNEDGSANEMTGKVDVFKKRLEKLTDTEIILSDERYTSEEAEKYLHLQGKSIKGNKGRIDAISAALILDDYLRERENG
jgi:putative Holliday junction resolvase